jgi:hypothetical protein
VTFQFVPASVETATAESPTSTHRAFDAQDTSAQRTVPPPRLRTSHVAALPSPGSFDTATKPPPTPTQSDADGHDTPVIALGPLRLTVSHPLDGTVDTATSNAFWKMSPSLLLIPPATQSGSAGAHETASNSIRPPMGLRRQWPARGFDEVTIPLGSTPTHSDTDGHDSALVPPTDRAVRLHLAPALSEGSAVVSRRPRRSPAAHSPPRGAHDTAVSGAESIVTDRPQASGPRAEATPGKASAVSTTHTRAVNGGIGARQRA